MQVLNRPPVSENKDIGSITVKGKAYYVCNVCGRLSFRKISSDKKVWCYKHYKQKKKYGHAIDSCPRTIEDRNEIIIDGDIAYVKLYDKHQTVAGVAKIDAEDVPKIRYIKWKLSKNGYAMNSPKYKSGNIHMSRVILGTNQFVDHINHDTLDNRKSNLRIVTKSQNQMNSNYKGVTERKDGRFYAYIKLNQHLYHLGVYVDKEEALYARWYAEQLLFKGYAYPKPEPFILDSRKTEIRCYVDRKVQRL